MHLDLYSSFLISCTADMKKRGLLLSSADDGPQSTCLLGTTESRCLVVSVLWNSELFKQWAVSAQARMAAGKEVLSVYIAQLSCEPCSV